MAMTAARIEITTAALECHVAKRDALAVALRSTHCLHERSQLLLQHAEACRCIGIFEVELAKA